MVLYFFADSELPCFDEEVQNVTVTKGRDALLACIVDNLRNFRVSLCFVFTENLTVCLKKGASNVNLDIVPPLGFSITET